MFVSFYDWELHPHSQDTEFICLEHEVTASFDLVSSWVLRTQFQEYSLVPQKLCTRGGLLGQAASLTVDRHSCFLCSDRSPAEDGGGMGAEGLHLGESI